MDSSFHVLALTSWKSTNSQAFDVGPTGTSNLEGDGNVRATPRATLLDGDGNLRITSRVSLVEDEEDMWDQWDKILEKCFIRHEECFDPRYEPDPCWRRLMWKTPPSSKENFPGLDCSAVGIAEIRSKYFYTSAAKNHEDGWHVFGLDPYTVVGFDAHGMAKEYNINEMDCLLQAIEGRTAPGGFWLGREKYNITSVSEELIEGGGREQVVRFVFANRPGKGVYMASIDGKVIVCVWVGSPDWHGGACKHYIEEFSKQVLEQDVFVAVWGEPEDDGVTGGKAPIRRAKNVQSIEMVGQRSASIPFGVNL